MQTATTSPAATPSPQSSAMPRRLDDLDGRRADVLLALYHAASAPRLADLAGEYRGRILAVPGVAIVPRPLARAGWIGWAGKSFDPPGANAPGRGTGRNLLLGGRWRAFPFVTTRGPSRAVDADAVHLDYDLADNPSPVRRIRDEIRELTPGLYLGQAYFLAGNGSHLWLYFALGRG